MVRKGNTGTSQSQYNPPKQTSSSQFFGDIPTGPHRHHRCREGWYLGAPRTGLKLCRGVSSVSWTWDSPEPGNGHESGWGNGYRRLVTSNIWVVFFLQKGLQPFRATSYWVLTCTSVIYVVYSSNTWLISPIRKHWSYPHLSSIQLEHVQGCPRSAWNQGCLLIAWTRGAYHEAAIFPPECFS